MYFHQPVNAYLKSIKFPNPPKTPYSARYIGSMVADVHRTLLYGGIFGYPNDKKSKTGKLRLLYEAFPMAFLTEQVSGIVVAYLANTDPGHRLEVLLRLALAVSLTSSPLVFTIVARFSSEAETTFWI